MPFLLHNAKNLHRVSVVLFYDVAWVGGSMVAI